MTIQEAREQGERLGGQRLDDQEFARVLEYATRKSRMTGHDDDYIPLLLVDEVKDYIYRNNQEKREERKCALSASIVLACADALTKKFPFMGHAVAAEMILKLAAELSISMETVIARIASMQ